MDLSTVSVLRIMPAARAILGFVLCCCCFKMPAAGRAELSIFTNKTTIDGAELERKSLADNWLSQASNKGPYLIE